MGRTTRCLLAGLTVLWMGAAAPGAIAEEAIVPPPAAEATDEAAAAPALPGEQSMEEGAVELNEAPAGVMPGYDSEGQSPMCPHHRGKTQLPSV